MLHRRHPSLLPFCSLPLLLPLFFSTAAGAIDPTQPCETLIYPSFAQAPAAPPVQDLPAPDPTGEGARWDTLIRFALRPDPKKFSWYRECGVWTCRYQQQDQVVWQSFPVAANSCEIAGTVVAGRLLIAPIRDLMKQGMAIEDLRPFSTKDLGELESHAPVHPQEKS